MVGCVPCDRDEGGNGRQAWRGDGGGAGMGQISVTANGLAFSASPAGCANCGLPDCRWSVAEGSVVLTGETATLDAKFATCGGNGGTESMRGTLEIAANGRNVLYWTPAKISTQWIRNA